MKITHSVMKTSMLENFMRSAKAPTISAGVMIAKVIWKVMKTLSGIVPESASIVEARQEEIVEAADPGVHRAAVAEGQRIADDHPDHRHQRGDREYLRAHRDEVLLAHHAAVKKREARNGHHQHQRGGGDHPGGVAGTQFGDFFLGERGAGRRGKRQNAGGGGKRGPANKPPFFDCVGHSSLHAPPVGRAPGLVARGAPPVSPAGGLPALTPVILKKHAVWADKLTALYLLGIFLWVPGRRHLADKDLHKKYSNFPICIIFVLLISSASGRSGGEPGLATIFRGRGGFAALALGLSFRHKKWSATPQRGYRRGPSGGWRPGNRDGEVMADLAKNWPVAVNAAAGVVLAGFIGWQFISGGTEDAGRQAVEAPIVEAPVEEPAPRGLADIDGARIAAADTEPGNWLSHGRTYDEQRFSPLDDINDGNIGELALAWSLDTYTTRGLEATPIVVDGIMYLSLNWGVTIAVDAKSGNELWRFDPEVPGEWGRYGCCDVVNRGVAVWKGRVYTASFDGRLFALDATDGSVVWEVNTIPGPPYTITGAPRVFGDKVVIGNGGAEYGVRGYITAYDTETGEQAWRFYTVPGDPALPVEHPELEGGDADVDNSA